MAVRLLRLLLGAVLLLCSLCNAEPSEKITLIIDKADLKVDFNRVALLEKEMAELRELLKDHLQNKKHDQQADGDVTSARDTLALKKLRHDGDFRPLQDIADSLTVPTFTTCKAAYNQGYRSTGMYRLNLSDGSTEDALCDQQTNGGGWRVIQQRRDGSEDFYRDWYDYKFGFGIVGPESNFWLGNEGIRRLTMDQKATLRIDMTTTVGETGYAEYSTFYIDDESANYTLHISGFSSLANADAMTYHDGQMFTTRDRDNDGWTGGNRAQWYYSAFWYAFGYEANPNGVYGVTDSSRGIRWRTWSSTDPTYRYLSAVRMMVR